MAGSRPAARRAHWRWWRRRSLRARLTVVSTALVGAGMVVAAMMLMTIIGRSLQSALDTGVLQSAREVAALVDAGRLPDPVPVGSEQTAVIQVVDANNGVRAASAQADRLVALLRPDELARARAGERLLVSGDRAGLDGLLRVVAVPCGTARDPQTVLVAAGYGGIRDSARTLHVSLLLGMPLLLTGVALVSWWVIGRTLRPVEALRRGAAEITGTGTSTRLPVPAAQDEVHRLAETLNDMLGRLAAASERQRSFVSDAAHELRNPLASLRTQLEVAGRLGRSVELAELTQDALIDVERLSGLVDDLLLLARVDEAAPRRAPRREVVDLRGVAAGMLGRYRTARVPVRLRDGSAAGPAAGAAGPAGPAATVLGEPEALGRVLANLVDNAVRHARSTVDIDVGTVDGRAWMVVTDDGPGIPVADRERVFDRFTRLDAGRDRESGGAGLGLAIVRELVRTHGGTVTLADADPGLRARVELPAVHLAADSGGNRDEADSGRPAEDGTRTASAGGAPEKIQA
jgi:signal transduction histidine kinase